MILPAKSARKAVRLRCSNSITSLSHIYTFLMSAWITNTPSAKELRRAGPPLWANSFRDNLFEVAIQLRDLKEMAGWARWEGNVRGHWPYEEYDRLTDIQQEMISVFAHVCRLFHRTVCLLMIRKSSPVRSQSSTTSGDRVFSGTPKS
jgi:hypothetical protein